MDAEERHLLPLLETSHAREVAEVRAEHARIRQLVSELGVAIELHAARQPAIEELVETLRSHSEHEDRVLYRLVDAPAHVRDKIGVALRAAARLTGARRNLAKTAAKPGAQP